MKNLADSLEHAEKQKQSIINNKHTYYYIVDCYYQDKEEKNWFSDSIDIKRTIKKVPRIPNKPTTYTTETFQRVADMPHPVIHLATFGMAMLGSLVLPTSGNKSGYYKETLFDQGQYDKDLQEADREVQQRQNAVQRYRAERDAQASQQEAQRREAQKYAAEQRAAQEREKKLQEELQHKRLVEDLKTKIQKETELLAKKENNLPAKLTKAQDQLSIEISQSKQFSAQHQAAMAQHTKLNEQHISAATNNKVKIDNMSIQERTLLLANSFERKEAGKLVDHIKSVGFDANYLGYLAIKPDNQRLLELAMAYHADCSGYIHDGKTLLQLAIELKAEASLQKILSISTNFNTTFINAINQQNFPVIDKLLTLKPDILQQEAQGLNLLRIAIITAKPEVLQRLLAFDSAAIKILSDKEGSIFKLAAKTNPAVISSLVSYIDLKQEFAALIKAGELELCRKIVIEGCLDAKAITELLEVALAHKATDLAQQLASNGAALTQSWSSAIEKGDEAVIVQLTQIDSHVKDHQFLSVAINQQQEQISTLPLLKDLDSFEAALLGKTTNIKHNPDHN